MTLFRQGNPVPPGPPGTLSRMVVLPPDMERVLRFYTAHAPEDASRAGSVARHRRHAEARLRAKGLRARTGVEDAVGLQRAFRRHRSRRQARDRRHRDELRLRDGRTAGGPSGQAAGHRRRHPAPVALGAVRPGQGRARRPAGRQPRVVPARRPPARRRRVAPADGGRALRRVRVDRLPTGRRRRGRRLQRRRKARPAGGRIRVAQHRVHRPADQSHRRLLAAVVRDDAAGRAHRAPSTSSRPT